MVVVVYSMILVDLPKCFSSGACLAHQRNKIVCVIVSYSTHNFMKSRENVIRRLIEMNRV